MSFIKRYIQGRLKNNCYVFNDGDNIAIIDPGDDGQRIEAIIKNISTQPKISIFLTHGHADQILCVPFLVQKFPKSMVYAGRSENLFLFDAGVNLSRQMGNPITFTNISDNLKLVTTGEEMKVGKYTMRVYESPGHTPGSVLYALVDHDVIFSGDTILREGIGGTFLPFGNENQLMTSIRDRILTFSEDSKLFPAHGEPTDIKHEKKFNPYILTMDLPETSTE